MITDMNMVMIMTVSIDMYAGSGMAIITGRNIREN